MELKKLKNNIATSKEKILKLIEGTLNHELKDIVEERLNKLLDFLEEDNINLLDKAKKNSSKKDKLPLDILCEEILLKLSEIQNIIDGDITEDKYNKSNSLQKVLQLLIEEKLTFVFNILKHLDGHNKTILLLGANGSGKTSLANLLRNVTNNIKVIPALKPLEIKGSLYETLMDSGTIDSYNEELYRGGVLKENLLGILINSVCKDHTKKSLNLYNSRNNKVPIEESSIFEKTKEIFDDFFNVKLYSNNDGKIEILKGENSIFDFNNMSDGERAAFFYIATIVIAPKNSFIVVDEPENHLNPAIYNKIWDRLIEERSDCQFIFISHTMEFINARSNFEVMKIENFTYPDKFEFEFLGDGIENLDPNFIVEVLGSRKPILFCEGLKSSCDYKIYEILFGEAYTVIPAGNCIEVQKSVEACNNHKNILQQSAKGIIDSDLKNDETIKNLKEKQIYVLKCNEIEMLLIDEDIFQKSLEHIDEDKYRFNEFKDNFFKKIEKRKNYIIKRLVKLEIEDQFKKIVIDDKTNNTRESLKENFKNITQGIDSDTLWDEYDDIMTKILEDKDYDDARKYCCLEHKEVIGGIANRFIHNYEQIAFKVLRDNEDIKEQIKKNYFNGL